MAGLRSMTGFGRGEVRCGSGALVVEVKCQNSRHLDPRLRLPRELAVLEPELRELLGSFFLRGGVDLSLRVPAELTSQGEVEVDVEAARRYLEAGKRLRSQLGGEDALSLSTLLQLPGVTRLREPELDPQALREAVIAAAREACQKAQEMRQREGAHLAEELCGRLAESETILARIQERAEEVARGLRERLEKRLAALAPELSLSPGRVEQEVVIYADRMDTSEETVRLRSHLAQFRETLREPGAIGRKLEFLLQEMGREVNTIGSKCADVPVTREVVELKTELEKLREQVANVE